MCNFVRGTFKTGFKFHGRNIVCGPDGRKIYATVIEQIHCKTHHIACPITEKQNTTLENTGSAASDSRNFNQTHAVQ
jgi:hypothetical protein